MHETFFIEVRDLYKKTKENMDSYRDGDPLRIAHEYGLLNVFFSMIGVKIERAEKERDEEVKEIASSYPGYRTEN